jgi:hypothetical protein
LHINFFKTVKKTNDMTNLQRSTNLFFNQSKDLFFDAYLDYRTKNVESIIFKSDRVWVRFIAITKQNVVIDLDYLQDLFNLELIEFKKEMKQYFA